MLLFLLLLESGCLRSRLVRLIVYFVDACRQRHNLLALEVLLFTPLVPFDEVMELNGPESQTSEHTLAVDLPIEGEDGG